LCLRILFRISILGAHSLHIQGTMGAIIQHGRVFESEIRVFKYSGMREGKIRRLV